MALSVTPTTPQNDKIRGDPNGFKLFDVVSDHSDHHYSIQKKGGGRDNFTTVASNVHKMIMREWKILEKHLPNSIYVRVYETRIDLLTAVMVGAPGTPYHDALFFFDIAFPRDYPTHPPQVHYRSFGLRLNPNLYATGYVCLSLLNTWVGEKKEKWDPNQSTILQILLSIQALVLNEKPYFNEPGHGVFGRARCENASRTYNEDAFVLTCKTTLFLLRKPPKNFEDFTAGHFRQRAGVILRACIAYANGRVLVGYYKDENYGCAVTKVRQKFVMSMEQLYPQLVAAFKRNGACVGGLVEQLKVERKTTPSRAQGKGIVKKVVEKFIKVLGWKKKSGSGKKRKAGVAAAEG